LNAFLTASGPLRDDVTFELTSKTKMQTHLTHIWQVKTCILLTYYVASRRCKVTLLQLELQEIEDDFNGFVIWNF
jgi:hypothetical protein